MSTHDGGRATMSASHRRPAVLLAAVALTLAAVLVTPRAGSALPLAASSKHMQWQAALPSVTGSSMDFFERRVPDGTLRRYAAIGKIGHGVEFVDVTDPGLPVPVGVHLSPGVNYHTDVQVNPARDLLVLNVDWPGVNVAMGVGPGIEFVDISDLGRPRTLGVVGGLEGPHKLQLVGDRHVYTTLPSYVIDYTDPTRPQNLGRIDEVCAHGVALDQTNPGIAYHASCQRWMWKVVDVSDPASPRTLVEVRDLELDTPHDAIPTPDSSTVAVSDLLADYAQLRCPGGGVHFYDLSGRRVTGSSPQRPGKLGAWFAPFTGLRNDPGSSDPYASCTLHGFQMNAERPLIATGNYAGGAWIVDVDSRPDGEFYEEFRGTPGRGLGPTTWGKTLGHWMSVGDFTWYLKWAPFDDPRYERTLFSISPVHGFEVFSYTGPLPAKLSHLTLAAESGDGRVQGRLGRYPLLSPEGWRSRPLAGQAVEVSAAGRTVSVTTAADGTFAAGLDLPPGTHAVTARWAGDGTFRPTTASATVRVP